MGVNQRAQIQMTDAEIAAFVTSSRVATLATIGPSGLPHLVAMWYGVLDGQLWFETKEKSQKARNLTRDPRVTVMIEAGDTYDTLRGVSIEGRVTIVTDPAAIWRVGVSVWERYTGPYTEQLRPALEAMLHKRIVARVDADRVRSWDHRKLGLPAMPLAGTTAPPATPQPAAD